MGSTLRLSHDFGHADILKFTLELVLCVATFTWLPTWQYAELNVTNALQVRCC